MKQVTGWTKWMGIGAVAAITMAGCTPQQEATVEDGAADTGQAVENTVDAAGEFATITPSIKTALGDNRAMDGSNIDVDTDVTNNVVHLHGTVVDEAQRNLAEQIARQELQKIEAAQNYTVTNELTVGAATGDVAPATGDTAPAPATP